MWKEAVFLYTKLPSKIDLNVINSPIFMMEINKNMVSF